MDETREEEEEEEEEEGKIGADAFRLRIPEFCGWKR